jgi:hypothetical protein
MQTKEKKILKREFIQAELNASKREQYIEDRLSPENFSFWFPKIKNCGMKVPESQFFIMPLDVFMGSIDKICDSKVPDTLIDWINQEVAPNVSAYGMFLKNGIFSNKFNFNNCLTTSATVAQNFIDIQYGSLLVGAGGLTELVLREYIHSDRKKTATIYNGLPLRVEARVFYDFDARKTLYTANYWDYNYVASNLYDRADAIIFNHVRPEIEKGFAEHSKAIEVEVCKRMASVTGLDGIWSVDVMVDEKGQYWLIDMARGFRSTYNEGLYDEAALEAYKSGRRLSDEPPFLSPELFVVPEMRVKTYDGETVVYRRQGKAVVKYVYGVEHANEQEKAVGSESSVFPIAPALPTVIVDA